MEEFVLRNVDDVAAWKEYIDSLYNRVNYEADKIIEEKIKKCKNPFERKKSGEGIATLKAYIIPSDVSLCSPEGIVVPISVVSNPSMKIEGENAVFYLRVASVGSYFGRTFIARAKVPLNNLRGRIHVNAEIFAPSVMPYECVEDARIDPEFQNEVYHVRGLYRSAHSVLKRLTKYGTIVLTFRGHEKEGKLESVEAVHFDDGKNLFLLRDYRDTFPLNKDYMIIRPFVKEKEMGGVFIGPREGAKVMFNEMEPVPELIPNWKDEAKTGGNIAFKLSANEYVLLYHVVDSHGVYYTYATLFNDNGELLAHSTVPILAPSVKEYYGRRPSTIFVCGAALYKDNVIISAGRDDEITVIYEIEVNKLFEHMKYLKG